MVQFTDTLQLVLERMVVGQPTRHLFPFLGTNAALLVPATRVINGKHPRWVPTAAGTGLTALLMPDRALQQRAAQNLGW